MLLDGVDAAIVLPGSIGTLAELVVSWNVRFVARHGISPDLILVAVGTDWGEVMPILANRLAIPHRTGRVVGDRLRGGCPGPGPARPGPFGGSAR